MRYKILDQNGINFLTFTIVDWIDLFTRSVYSDIVLDSFRFCQKEKGLKIFAYVIMPSHIHVIIQTDNPLGLSSIIQSFKSYTAKAFLAYIQDKRQKESRREWLLHHFSFHAKKAKTHSQYQVWKKGNHPIVLYSPSIILQKLHYIHANPVRANIVTDSTHYLYSSASNYYHGSGILDIQILEEAFVLNK